MKQPLIISVVFSVLLICVPARRAIAADNTAASGLDNGEAEPYKIEEFPAWSRDMRRAEIITIGSLPFTTLAATLCYSLGRYAVSGFDFNYVPNPFAKSGVGSFNQTEQIGVFATAGGISICIGITDLVIRIHQRHKKERLEREKENDSIIITPLEDDDGESHHYPPPLPSPNAPPFPSPDASEP